MPPIERSLPLSGKRWVVRRKVVLIEAVRSGEITLDEACRQYQLSPEEFNGWVSTYEKHGAPGLRVTRYQIYRALGRRAGRLRGQVSTQAPPLPVTFTSRSKEG